MSHFLYLCHFRSARTMIFPGMDAELPPMGGPEGGINKIIRLDAATI
jgi:hypothetical protein